MALMIPREPRHTRERIDYLEVKNAKLKERVKELEGLLIEVAPFHSGWAAPKDLQDRIDAIAYPEEPTK